MNKKIAAAALATALSFGTLATISTANADMGHAVGVPPQVATVLSGLVTKGTINQGQADAITAALTAAAPARPIKPMAGGMGIGGMNSAAHEAVITSTLGITAADLKAARVAGKSLATLAGDKKAALITALINFETTEIDAAVTAGKMTAARATTAKAGLTARVTAQVEKVPGSMVGSKGEGHEKGMKSKTTSIKKKA
jgi:multidrug efflux pump subunit AcrA (membrane-fusion protein)